MVLRRLWQVVVKGEVGPVVEEEEEEEKEEEEEEEKEEDWEQGKGEKDSPCPCSPRSERTRRQEA